MKLIVNNKSEQPIYEQLYRQIAAGILSGEYAADTCLPSIRAVSAQLGISVITVKGAYDRLESDGYIYTRAGKGCFIKAQTDAAARKLSFLEEKLLPVITECLSLGVTEREMIELIEKAYRK